MKRTKRLISIILALLMIFSAMPLTAFAEDTQGNVSGYYMCPDGEDYDLHWSYTASTDTLYLDGKVIGSIPIENDITHLPLYYINDEGKNVLWEGSYSNVIFSKNVETLEELCLGFDLITEYTNFNVSFSRGSKLKTIADYAFCTYSIYEMIIPDTVNYIGECAFSAGEYNLLRLPDNETEELVIRNEAFSESSIVNFDFNNCNIREIPIGAFKKAYLVNFEIPEGIRKLNKSAFLETNFQKAVVLPSTIEQIDNYCFENCSAPSIKMPSYTNKTITLGEAVFYGSIIDNFDFNNCNITHLPLDTFFKAVLKNITLSRYIEGIGTRSFYEAKVSCTLELPSNLKRIGSSAFYKSKINKIIFPDPHSIEEILDSAFGYCTVTEDSAFIINPDVNTKIASNAFRNSNIQVIEPEEPESLIDTEHHSVSGFFNHENNDYDLTWSYNADTDTLYLDAKIIELFTFDKLCTLPLTYKNTYGQQILWNGTFHNVIFSNNVIELTANCLGIQDWDNYGYVNVVFEENSKLEKIGYGAFDYANIKRMIIPDSVYCIEHDAFFESTLEYVKLPNYQGDKEITLGDQIFAYCNNIEIDMSETNVDYIPCQFVEGTTVKSIAFPKNLKKIENNAFWKATVPYDLHIPDTVEEIGKQVFYNAKINNIYFGSGIKTIGEEAFMSAKFAEGCSVFFSDNATDVVIDKYAFTRSNIASINIPSCVKVINEGVFKLCASLSNVNFDDYCEITAIKGETFRECKKLESIAIPDSVEKIETSAFLKCTALTTVDIDALSELKQIGIQAFMSCYALENITLPSALEYIGREAFFECTNLKRITFPASLKEIGVRAFEKCTMLESVSFKRRAKLETIGESAFNGCDELNYISIPELTRNIGNMAFCHCDNLEYVILPPMLEYLGYSAFENCVNLKSVNIPENEKLTKILSSTFKNDKLLETEIPWTINYVADYAFYNCNLIEEIPDTIEYFGRYSFSCTGIYALDFSAVPQVTLSQQAFSSCPALTSVDFGNTTVKYGTFKDYIFACCTNLKYVTLSENMGYIPNYCFYQTGIENIILPDSLQKINDYAFSETLLKSIEIPGNVWQIWDGAFKKCENLSSVTFKERKNDNLNIWDEAFSECTSLKSIDIPESVTNIAEKCFYKSGLESISLPDTVTEIKEYAFYMSNLKAVAIPEDVTVIGKYAFSGTLLSEILFDENSQLKSIEKDAFYGCLLENIDLPESLETIGDNAFNFCRFKSITFGVNCNSVGLWTFDQVPLEEVTVLNKETLIDGSGIFRTGEEFVGYDQYGQENYRYTYNTNGIIYGYKGSTAEEYANDIGCVFSELEDEPEDPPESKTNTWKNGRWSISTSDYKTLYIYGYGSLEDADPIDYNNEIVTFKYIVNKYNIEKLYIAEGITEIPDGFMYSEDGVGISFVQLPTSLEKIGDYAFAGSSIKKLYSGARGSEIKENNFNSYIPKGVTHIGKYAFAYTDSLEYEFELPKELTEISEGLFYQSNVRNVQMVGKVTKIGKKAFAECSNISSLYVPCSVTDIYTDGDINNNAFGFAEGKLNENLWVIGRKNSFAQQYCRERGINFSEQNGLPYRNGGIGTRLGNIISWEYFVEDDYLILSSSNAQNITINGSLIYNEYDYDSKTYSNYTSISGYDDMFIHPKKIFVDKIKQFNAPFLLSCFNPEIIEFNISIEKIGDSTFENCTKIEEISLPDPLSYAGKRAFANCTSLKKVRLGHTITDISESLFSECRNLESVDLGNVIIKNIGARAFYNCNSLKFVNLSNQISYNRGTIGEYAFYNCVNLQQINIPSNIKVIETKAFYNCVQAQSITLSSNVERIDREAFANIFYCERININSEVNAASVSKERNIFTNLGAYTNGIELNIGDNVENLDCEFFKDLNITDINLGNSVSNIENKQYLEALETITANGNPNYTVKNDCLYSGISLELVPQALTKVVVDPSTRIIADYACYGTNAKSITLPDSVAAIGAHCFENSKALTGITLPDDLADIPEYAFKGCTKLRLLNVPESTFIIKESAFECCSALVSAVFNNSLYTIGKNAFKDCAKLEGLAFPEELYSIQEGAFMNCSNLKYAYIWNTLIGDDAFANCEKLNIFTPVGTDAYRYAREFDIPYSAYTDEELFFDEWAIKIDALAGYLGYCEEDGHGDIEYLTVYEADCEHDGFIIGVCEYCSEILEEIHIDAYGHNYQLETEIPSTATTRGINVYRCDKCNQSYTTYSAPLDENYEIQTHTVSGRIELSGDKYATAGISPARKASIVINDTVAATTDDDGYFSLELETGTYEARIKYAYGFTRTIYIQVKNQDIKYKKPIVIIGCDFSKDGKIDDEDIKLFQMIISAKKNDPSYLNFVDLNNDGYINAKDLLYIKACSGLSVATFRYQSLIIN